jgi:hypothetical protein
MPERLANELIDAGQQQGEAYKRKDDIYRMAQANKAFAWLNRPHPVIPASLHADHAMVEVEVAPAKRASESECRKLRQLLVLDQKPDAGIPLYDGAGRTRTPDFWFWRPVLYGTLPL